MATDIKSLTDAIKTALSTAQYKLVHGGAEQVNSIKENTPKIALLIPSSANVNKNGTVTHTFNLIMFKEFPEASRSQTVTNSNDFYPVIWKAIYADFAASFTNFANTSNYWAWGGLIRFEHFEDDRAMSKKFASISFEFQITTDYECILI